MRLVLAAAAAALAISGCQNQEETERPASAASTAAAPAPPATPPAATRAQWLAAAKGTYVTTNSKTDGDGVTEFSACFPAIGEKCPPFMRGKRDAFRKLTIFTPAKSLWNRYGAQGHVVPYFSVLDCGPPVLLINPTYSASSWLFMEKVAFMADGEVVLEREFQSWDGSRETVRDGVMESIHWAVDPVDLVKVRALLDGKTIIIRLTGQKGYVSMDKSRTADFMIDLARTLKAMDSMSAALPAVADCST